MLPKYLAGGTYKVGTFSDDVVADDEWSIPSTFLQQTVKQLEVIQEVFIVFSEVKLPTKLNDFWKDE